MKAISLGINQAWNFIGCQEKIYKAASYKKQAIDFAKQHNWPVKNVHRGYDRFFSFYFVGQMVSPTQWRILRQDGTVAEIDCEERKYTVNQ